MIKSKIEWTDATWNPIVGCSMMSSGCTHCYAMQMAKRLDAMGMKKYKGLTRTIKGRAVWKGVVREDEAALEVPYRWRKPRKIFVNSMSDLFHDKVSSRFIELVWQVMRDTPQHQYQILTKRPKRMLEEVGRMSGSVLSNVWLGTSVEAANASHRIAVLRDVPAQVRFISFEPLIGSVGEIDLTNIHWAIVGGESGHKARMIKKEWVDRIHERCIEADTAFFFKQWGTWGEDNQRRSKKANGRHYKGRLWDEMPV